MFLHSGYRLRASKDESACFEVDTNESFKFNQISILKIHQYESKFQSMSVLVFDHETCKHYVFVKGAP
jgi:magnesium-transporting ATPase (P-type)